MPNLPIEVVLSSLQRKIVYHAFRYGIDPAHFAGIFKMSTPDIEVTSKPFVGFRGWYLREGCLVAAAFRECKWRRKMVAQAQPSPNDSVGIHAYKGPKTLHTYYDRLDVFGTVLLYGRVIVHEMGYRAEKAMVHSIFLHHASPTVANLQRMLQYQCPIFDNEPEWLDFVKKEMIKWGW